MHKKFTILILLLMPTMVMGARDTRSELGKRKAEASPAGEPSAQRPMSYFSEESIDSYISQEITLGVSAEDLEAFQQELSQSNYSNASWSDNQSLSFHPYEDSSRNSIQPTSSEIVSSEDLEAFQHELSRDASEWSNSLSASFQVLDDRNELERSDLDKIAQELFAEEVLEEAVADNQLPTDSEDINQGQQSEKIRYFCPECFSSFIYISNYKQIRHQSSCSLQHDLTRKNVLSIDAPLIIKNKLHDIYYLHPTKGGIYLQHSTGLNENNFTINADGSFTYDDGENIKAWDKFGFECDVITCQRLANVLDTTFEIINRRPCDAKKEYFKCPKLNCGALQGNQDYQALVDHLKAVHKSKTPYICNYNDCTSTYVSPRHLKNNHEVKHLGIEFICPFCAECQQLERNLKNKHIKKLHPEQIV